LTFSLHFLHRRLILALQPRKRPTEKVTQGIASLRYLFEEYAFDTDLRELYRGADVVSIAPQVFDLLDYLIRNRERVVSKDDLINTVWNGRVMSDAALTTRLNVARSVLGDSGEKQRLIKTLPRKGFRFVGTVQEVRRPADTALTANFGEQSFQNIARLDWSNAAAQDGLASGVHNGGTMSISAVTPRLSIVVLPFANFGGDPEQDYFADGITESLTTDLSRISGSFVIGRHTAFTYKGKAADLKKIGRELNVRYVLEGSVQRGGNRLRVNAQLVDAETGNHLWAERFEKPVADLFDMQDEIVSRLANTLNAQLIEVEARRAGRSTHPDAMDLYFQGWACANNGTTAEYMTQAQAFFDRALALDPGNIEALVGSARVKAAIGGNLETDDWKAHLAAAEVALTRALSLAPSHARAHSVLGLVQSFTNRGVQGIAECERALALDHNLADAHAFIGLAKFFLGRGKPTSSLPLTSLYTFSEIKMPPGSATPSSRTAMLIPSPNRSPSAPTITSPRLTPMRSLRELRPDAMLSCISTAHRTAADGLANSASAPSPVVLMSRPSWRERLGSINSRLSRSNSA
jgi:TolB-like protein/DNA-binding winged helix-turn-helix (wHTH) protein